ncbi:MAG: polysaccharide biosynthesis tyrosine autokinase [Acidobacteriota bacterium]|nr:MAG: polysaccharide biosynthesis tyrosine autokinase [Acidobacteriota bacterium]
MRESRDIVRSPRTEKAEIERPFEAVAPITSYGYARYRNEDLREHSPLFQYWRIIRKRLWLVLGITVLLTTVTAIYMARKPNIYMANATVQVDLEQANQDLVTPDRRMPLANSDPAYFNTQLQLLTSEALLRRVIKELSLDTNEAFRKDSAENSGSALRGMLVAFGLASDDSKKEGDLVEEAPLASNTELATVEEMNEAVRLAPYVDAIKRDLIVDPVRESRATVKDTRLISISYRNTDPNLSAYVVNGIAEVFSRVNQEKRTGINRKTNDFLKERIADLQSEIKAGEERLVDLKKNAGILKADENTTIVIQRLSGLNKQLLEAEEQRKNAEAQYNSVNTSPARLAALAEEQMMRYITERENDIRRFVNDTQKEITALRAKRQKMLIEYVEQAPEIREIDREMATLEGEIEDFREKNQKSLETYRKTVSDTILENLRTRYLQTKEREDKVRSAFNEQYNEAQGQNQSAVAITLLEQDIETKKGFYKNLENQQKGNDLAGAGTENNISVAEIAIPPDRPVSPRRLTTVFVVMILSLMFGSGLALFLEYLDDTIKTTEEAESYLQLPALAAIPTVESSTKRRLLLVGVNEAEEPDNSNQLLISKDSRSSTAEAYRQLRTSILLSTAGHAPKSLLITSSLPAEGKTTTAVNTAISLAQTGAKVLVIDADMRRPRVHSFFNLSNAEGLSTVLSSELTEKEILEIVKKDEDSGLHLLPSGPLPPNPAELVGSEQMKNLLVTLEKNFTHLVIDSPPIASFTDGVLMASLVDGVIMVVHSGKSSRSVVRRSTQFLHDIGAKVFGVVLNNVDVRSQDNYYYYQSYYHRDDDGDDAESSSAV